MSKRASRSAAIRVLVVDDHAIVRQGLKQIVSGDPEIEICGEASSGSAALAALRDRELDVMVLDLSLPDRSGLDVLVHAKAAHPRLHVLILSMESEEEFAIRALRGGASGYLEKRSAPEELVTAIKRVAEGKKYVSANVAERLILSLDRAGAERPHDLLTPREFEVFLGIADGKPVSRIARDLGLSVKTVSNHRGRILAKLGLKSTAELVRYAIRYQLIH